jgi:nucleoside 2-deoxyribosyltransferase
VKPKVYIAGPMRGLPNYNYPLFHETAAALRKAGFLVFNPAECPEVFEEEGIQGAMQVDLSWIINEADLIFLLPGWQKSDGACTEAYLGLTLGLPVYALTTGETLTKYGLVQIQRINALHVYHIPSS